MNKPRKKDKVPVVAGAFAIIAAKYELEEYLVHGAEDFDPSAIIPDLSL